MCFRPDTNYIGEQHYDLRLRQFFLESGIAMDGLFPVTPEEVAFQLGGGSLPVADSWQVRHLYAGSHPFEGRQHSLNALEEGDHFTQSAGLVAVRSTVAAAAYFERGCVVKTLRWLAFEHFGYDPDHYFVTDPDAHDHFGFVRRSDREVIIL